MQKEYQFAAELKFDITKIRRRALFFLVHGIRLARASNILASAFLSCARYTFARLLRLLITSGWSGRRLSLASTMRADKSTRPYRNGIARSIVPRDYSEFGPH